MTQDILRELKNQIVRDDMKTERDCCKYLMKIAWVLLSAAEGHTTFVGCEQYCSAGRLDLIVLADALQPGGKSRREAHIWELKAPQNYLFDLKTNNQAHPSQELYSAETQVIYYHYSVMNDGSLLRRWEILSPDHVKIGGIIIGRDSTLVEIKGKDEGQAIQIATQACEIREVYFYKLARIKLWTWDHVVSLAESQTTGHMKITGDPDTEIDIKESVELGATIVADLIKAKEG